jgi:predicted RecB family endonuclease
MTDTTQRVAIARRWIEQQRRLAVALIEVPEDALLPDLLLIADDALASAFDEHAERILARLAPHIPELKEHSDD